MTSYSKPQLGTIAHCTAPLSQSDICRRLQQQLRSLHTTVDSGKVQRGAAVTARQTVTLRGPSTRKHTDFRHTAQIIVLVWRVHVCACSQEHSRHFQATSVRGDVQRILPVPAHKLRQRDSWQSAAGEQHAMQSQRMSLVPSRVGVSGASGAEEGGGNLRKVGDNCGARGANVDEHTRHLHSIVDGGQMQRGAAMPAQAA